MWLDQKSEVQKLTHWTHNGPTDLKQWKFISSVSLQGILWVTGQIASKLGEASWQALGGIYQKSRSQSDAKEKPAWK